MHSSVPTGIVGGSVRNSVHHTDDNSRRSLTPPRTPALHGPRGSGPGLRVDPSGRRPVGSRTRNWCTCITSARLPDRRVRCSSGDSTEFSAATASWWRTSSAMTPPRCRCDRCTSPRMRLRSGGPSHCLRPSEHVGVVRQPKSAAWRIRGMLGSGPDTGSACSARTGQG